ncbi:MAG: hypothetical protein IIT95_05720, partial [Oscillospiraceae bacterium]|nr:hypothetical protein [Oscillospiraceae bacterium]
ENYRPLLVEGLMQSGASIMPQILVRRGFRAFVRDEMDARPSELILGVRSFTGDGVPRRSRTGNRLTTFVFRLMTGIRLSDTQTGLRGIPRMYFETALKVEGGRYEYEMNFLLDMAAANVHFTEVPI